MAETTQRLIGSDGEASGTINLAGDTDIRAKQRPRRRRRRQRVIAVSAVGVLGAGAAAGWAIGLFDRSESAAPAAAIATLDTAEVMRGDLVRTEGVSGELGYGEAVGVRAGAQGTVTALPDLGVTVGQGETLFEVDARPVTLLIGAVPMYRTLGPGDEGLDVAQLEDNLSRLGYTGFTVDDEYTWATADAVQEWQEDRGLAETGRVDPSQVVFAAGSVRVAGHTLTLGAPVQPESEVISATSTAQVVTIDLDIADRELVAADAAVTIELPDGSTINGHIVSIGSVAEVAESSDSQDQTGGLGGGQSDNEATIEVVVTIDEGESTGAFDQAPVEVNLESGRTEDVLSVPVAALIAIDNDQYAVEIVEDGSSQLVPVEIGTFANGRVEIAGSGITEGALVGVPRS